MPSLAGWVQLCHTEFHMKQLYLWNDVLEKWVYSTMPDVAAICKDWQSASA
jgi:hypothetical protein